MSFSLADARFQLVRALGLTRRGLASLRTRGLRATWQRVTAQLGVLAPAEQVALLAGDTGPFVPFSVPRDEAPEVTVVIPVYGELTRTLACLRAIAAHPPRVRIEIVVVDDGSPSLEVSDELESVGVGVSVSVSVSVEVTAGAVATSKVTVLPWSTVPAPGNWPRMVPASSSDSVVSSSMSRPRA